MGRLRRRGARWALAMLVAAPLAAQEGRTGTDAERARDGDAEVAPAAMAERIALHSALLGESRTLRVWLPPGYVASSAPHPVVYVLDGETYFLSSAGAVRYLAAYGLMPEAIVVAVHNTDRMRDLTPAPTGGWRPPPGGENGSADRFLESLAEEVIPFVEDRYRAAPFRVLAGHSLGGLFVAHALAERPGLFRGYLAMDPSVWWNEGHVVGDVTRAVAGAPGASVRLVVAQAGGSGFTAGWDDLVAGARAGFRGDLLWIEDESHQTMAHEATFSGLRALFADFPAPDPDVGGSPVAALLAHHERLGAEYGYTLEPPPGVLAQAVRATVLQGDFDGARRGIEALEAFHGTSETSRRLRGEVGRARSESDLYTFVPLQPPGPDPTPEELAPFLGVWRGTIVTDPGVDVEAVVTVALEGGGASVHSVVTGPDGRSFEVSSRILRMRPDGALEWGRPLGGNLGLAVSIVRQEGPDVLVGRDEARGVRLPKEGMPRTTFRLTRVR